MLYIFECNIHMAERSLFHKLKVNFSLTKREKHDLEIFSCKITLKPPYSPCRGKSFNFFHVQITWNKNR